MTHESTPSHMSDSTYRKTICAIGFSDISVYVLTEPEVIHDAFAKASLPFSQEERGDTKEVLRRMSDEWMGPMSLEAQHNGKPEHAYCGQYEYLTF